MKKIQLSIPEPCHENWDAMTPTQQGRYCNACAKEVIDFTGLSDTEVLNYFLQKKNEKICGMAYTDQLERNIAALPKKKWYWYWTYVITAFLFFAKANRAKAQTTGLMAPTVTETVNQKGTKNTSGQKQGQNNDLVQGIVKDENGNPVPYASAKIKGTPVGMSTGENGRFFLTKKGDSTVVEISAVGYITKEVVINDPAEKQIILQKEAKMMGEVVTTSYQRYIKKDVTCGGIRVKGKMISTKKNIVKDTVNTFLNQFSSSIKIYPNPVLKGNTFTVAMKLKQAGNYTVQVSDATGRLLTENKITTAVKEHNEEISSGSSWSADMYYIKVMDEKGKLISTSSLLLQ